MGLGADCDDGLQKASGSFESLWPYGYASKPPQYNPFTFLHWKRLAFSCGGFTFLAGGDEVLTKAQRIVYRLKGMGFLWRLRMHGGRLPRMSSPLFQPKSRLEPAFACGIKSGKFEHNLKVFRWEDRLVAHEEMSGLWWGALDAWDRRDAREFWEECLKNERVGRLFSHHQSFQKAGPNGATLLMGEGPYGVGRCAHQ